MLACSSAERGRAGRAWLALGLLALALLLPALPVRAGGITVASAEGSVVNDLYVVDARFDYRLGEQPREALRNGIALTVVVEVEIRRERELLWDKTAMRARQRFRIEQHALSGQYAVTNLTTGVRRTHAGMEEALQALGRVERMPVVDSRQLKPQARYRARIRAFLDIDQLPALLRPAAYVLPAWRLSSPWFGWEVRL